MDRTPFYNFDRIDKPIATINENWKNFRSDINKGIFSPNDIDSALKHIFLKTFNELFIELKNLAGLTKKLDVINSEYKIMRGAKISVAEYSNTITYNRLLPQKEYITDDNRFSPKGVEWLYLAISGDSSQAKDCCIKECRAKENDKFALVSFEIPDKYYDNKVIDLTVGVEYDYTELENYLENSAQNNYAIAKQAALNNETQKEKQMRRSKREKRIKERIKKEIDKVSLDNKEHLKLFLTLMYSKLISENIFEPVETDKSEKYAPFHCLAQYFLSIGYIGIIYSSTVCKNGKNLVLFDKNYAIPVGNISNFNV